MTNQHHNTRRRSNPPPARRAAATSSSQLTAVAAKAPPGSPVAPANDTLARAEEEERQAEALFAEAKQKAAAAREAVRAAETVERQAAVAKDAGLTPAQLSALDSLIDARVAAKLTSAYGPPLVLRTDEVEDDEDDVGVSETYEKTGMPARLDAIMELADKFGVITSGTVTKHIPGKDGKKWAGTPVRNQLLKLVRQRKLRMRSHFPPKGTTRGSTLGKMKTIYARTEEQLDAYEAKFSKKAPRS